MPYKHFLKLLAYIKPKMMRDVDNGLREQSVHFLHIGKTGGTAVKYAISQHIADDNCCRIFFHPHTVRLCDIPKGEKVIFFLRDPISRFVSGFYSRQRQGKPRYHSPWNESERVAFERFETPNQLALALSSLDADKKSQAESAMQVIEHVRNSYKNWFVSEDYFKSRLSDILFIGFQESLTEDFEILKPIIGLPNSAQLPIDDTLAHRNSIQLDKTLEEGAVANLKNWYNDDHQFVAFCKRHIKLQSSESKL